MQKGVPRHPADERAGSDADDGFATTESELAVSSDEAEVSRSRGSGSTSTVSRAVAKPIGEAQYYGIAQYSARTVAELTGYPSERGTNTTAATTVACSGQCKMHE